ncbi:hypothetical protein R5R35_013984 [Gryllus longicercus]|uniref:Fatty acyl-CoA reductase n=1 Tax=Gryllus longicercus TaxID=2509291 RepID=A0AAN9UZY9_9ORTH
MSHAEAGAGAGPGPGVAAWFEGRALLVTGGAGFMGKVLLEKMLRALPGLRRVYVLLRAKRGLAPARRLHDMLQLPVFSRVRGECPAALGKLVAVEGDLLLPGLGLAPAERALLEREVSVVVHAAASLRLESPLGPALRHNVLGTQRVLELAAGFARLEAFVHLSTAFCHPTQAVLEERCYPPPAPPHDLLRLAHWLDDDALNSLAPRLLGAHPNCYTFTKQLAESLVNDARSRMPVIIVRPSIVLPALEEPVAGWVDTLNGPMGLVAGAGKGVIRSMLVGRHFLVEVVPVDIAANAIICAAWDGALRGKEEAETPVYNLTSGDMVHMTWGEVLEVGRKLVYEEPFEGVVWYPDGDIRDSRLAHELIVFFFHTLPAYFIDLLLLLALQKTFMVRLQRRVRVGLELLQYFTTRQWRFATARARSLEARLGPRERRLLRLSVRDLDVEAALRAMLLGTRQFCFKEPLSSLPRARRHIKMLYVIHQLTKLLFWGALVYVPLMYITIFRTTLDAVCTQVFGNIPFPIVPIK